MAIATGIATMVSMDAILQNDYQAKLLDAVNNQAFIYNKLKTKVLNWTGKQAVYAVKVGRGELSADGSAAYTGGVVPAADHALWKNLNVEAKQLQGRGEIQSELMISTDAASAKAFVSAVTSENKGCEDNMIQKANKAFWSGGPCLGFLNEHKAGAGGVDLVNTDWEFAGNVAKLQAALTAGGGAGSVTVQLIQLDTYAVLGTTTVATVDQVASTINLAALQTATVAAGFLVGVKVSAIAANAGIGTAFFTALGYEPTGVYGQAIEPMHFTVDRTTATGTATQLQSNCHAANAAGTQARTIILPSMLQRMINVCEDNSGHKPNQILGHSSALERYAVGFQTNIRVAGSADKKGGAPVYNAGYGALAYGDLPFESDKDCCKGAVFLLNLEYWRLAEKSPIKLWTHGGSAFRPVANLTDVEFIYEGFHQAVCELPRTFAVLGGLTFA